MQATLETKNDGALALLMDAEAARAVFASILFAARFHESIAPLSTVAKQGMQVAPSNSQEGRPSCQ